MLIPNLLKKLQKYTPKKLLTNMHMPFLTFTDNHQIDWLITFNRRIKKFN